MIGTQNFFFAFGRVLHCWIECAIGITGVAMIFLLTKFRLAILGDVVTLTFCAAVHNYLCYHALIIPPVAYLPLPRISGG